MLSFTVSEEAALLIRNTAVTQGSTTSILVPSVDLWHQDVATNCMLHKNAQGHRQGYVRDEGICKRTKLTDIAQRIAKLMW